MEKIMSTTTARVRVLSGAVCTVLFFVTGLVGQFVIGDQPRDTAAHFKFVVADPVRVLVSGWLTLATAAFLLAAVLFLAGATRGRGSVWGAAGAAFGFLGFAGHTIIGMHSLLEVALTAIPLEQAVAVDDTLQHTVGSLVFVLTNFSVVALTLFSIALLRARIVSWPVAAGGLAMTILAFSGLPLTDQLLFPLGLVVFGWAAYRVVATERAAGWPQRSAPRVRVVAGAICAVLLMVVSIVKDAVFGGISEPAQALAAATAKSAGPVVEGFLAVAVGVLLAGTIAFLAGSTRSRTGRGNGLAAVGTVCGVVAAAAIVAMSLLDFLIAAFAQSGASAADAQQVMDAFGAVIFPTFMILFGAQAVTLAAFAAATWRARITGWVPFAIAVVFGAVAMVGASGPIAVAQMVLGLVVVAWLSSAILRAQATDAVVATTVPAPTPGAQLRPTRR
jgi:hypothetical protein